MTYSSSEENSVVRMETETTGKQSTPVALSSTEEEEDAPDKNVPISPKRSRSQKKINAEDTYFDREMCRFFWGDNYVQDDITGLGENGSGRFVDVLDK